MPMFDMPLEDLRNYQPNVAEPADFDAFWARTLAETRQHPLNASFERVDYGLRTLETYDVTFNGYGGQAIKGWFVVPAGTQSPLPTVVEFVGYGGGRNTPLNWLTWASAGYAFLVMDTRGQGSVWSSGDTPDSAEGANPFFPGFMTQGILSPHTYYYRRVMADAVRAIEAARAHPLVDGTRIAVTGGSQGGGLAIVATALSEGITAVMPEVPFLCHFARAIDITPDMPYIEIPRYLSVHRDKVTTVLETLSYFDGVNFCKRIRAPHVLFSAGLMDTICPPSTVFAAYNAVPARKEIAVYAYNGHDGGGIHHTHKKLQFLAGVL